MLSGDHSICRTLRSALNGFCAEPPQYDARRFIAGHRALREPHWQRIDAAANLDVVKHASWPHATPENREANWEKRRHEIEALAQSGELRLSYAEVSGLEFRNGGVTVFRLENFSPQNSAGFNQARLLFTEGGKRESSKLFELMPPFGAELFRYRGSWFLFGFDPHDRRFLAWEMSRPIPGPVAAIVRCSFQHVADRQAGN